MAKFQISTLLYISFLLAGCGSSPWVTMSTTPAEAETPEALFDEMKEAVNSRDYKKFYGCLTNECRKEQIHLMIHDLGRGGRHAKDTSDQSGVDLSQLKATPQACLVVIDKYDLARGKEISLDELPQKNFDAFITDMWHALQSTSKPFIEEETVIQEVEHHGNWACAKVDMPANRRGDASSYIYFKKVNNRWRLAISPFWYPWAKEPRLLSKQQKRQLAK